MTFSTGIALFGLFMAVVELYIPDLSQNLERFLGALQQKFVRMGRLMRNSPAEVDAWISRIWIGRFYSAWAVPLLVVGCLAFAASMYWSWENVGAGAMALLLLIVVPVLLFNYLMNIFGLLVLFLSGPIWIFDWTIRSLNFIGKGKALSGVGLLMALYGLVEPLMNQI